MGAQIDAEVSRPRELVPACLLLLLAESPGHGYQLMERLKALGFDWNGPGPIYRELHTLEEEGMVTSSWALGRTGPGRRVYEITPAGRAALNRIVGGITGLQALITEYLLRVGRLPPARRTRRPAARVPAGARRGDA
jgi:PadR family transcriptional regulator PadR